MSTKRHGGWGTPEYQRWCAMKSRCLNPAHKMYPKYGGRGIKVCGRWRESFENFLADMGKRPSPAHSLDRINNDGDYEPSNCRWTDRKTQANNTSRNIFLTFAGRTQTITQWSDELGFPREVIRRRIELGWPVEDALTTPADSWAARRKVAELRERGIPILNGKKLPTSPEPPRVNYDALSAYMREREASRS